MREKVFWRVERCVFPLRNRDAKLPGIPVDDDGGQQIEACDPKVLTFCGSISDFSLPPDPQGILQGVMRLTLVETDLGASLHVCVEQPFDDEQCALDAPNFSQRNGQIMLPWPRCQFFQELTRLHPARKHRRNAAQNIRPVGYDCAFANAVTYQAP